MKIIVLSENTARDGVLECEHGLSLYIEALGHRILFDMGGSDLFYKNAKKLGVNLSLVDFAVISHGHSDHGGGLESFLRINSHAPVYISPFAFEPHYNGQNKYIGLDADLAKESRLVFVEKEEIIDTGLRIFNTNGRKSNSPINAFGQMTIVNGELKKEDYRHEQYLEICEGERKILISGCSHRGILNIMEWEKPDVIIGGFHLSKITDNCILKDYAEKLSAYNTQYYTCHCTGTEQFKFMKQHINSLNYIACGDKIEF